MLLATEHPSLDALERRTVHAAQRLIVTSGWAKERLVAQHGVLPDRVAVVPPGVDPSPPTVFEPAGTRLLCVAAVTPTKGHDVLVEALRQVGDLAWTCVCAGPLDRDPAFAASVADPRVSFIGPRTDVGALYASADLLVHPSRSETYGMVLTEALARGIPVVASDTGGIPEAVGRTPLPGLLVPPGDAVALAAALRSWLTDASVRASLRDSAARRRATLPDWRHSVSLVSPASPASPASPVDGQSG